MAITKAFPHRPRAIAAVLIPTYFRVVRTTKIHSNVLKLSGESIHGKYQNRWCKKQLQRQI